MSNSEHGFYWDFAGSRQGADDPRGANATRNGLINNLIHLYDQSTPHLINFVADQASRRIELTPSAADTFEAMWTSPPFALNLQANGAPFPCVMRLGGSISNASYTATFRAILTPAYAPRVLEAPTDGYLEVTSGSTSDAWLGSDVLTPDRDTVDESLSTIRCDADFTGTSGESEWNLYRVDVFSKSTNVAGVPRLTGLLLRQYVGT